MTDERVEEVTEHELTDSYNCLQSTSQHKTHTDTMIQTDNWISIAFPFNFDHFIIPLDNIDNVNDHEMLEVLTSKNAMHG